MLGIGSAFLYGGLICCLIIAKKHGKGAGFNENEQDDSNGIDNDVEDVKS